jgi:heme exporter protein C
MKNSWWKVLGIILVLYSVIAGLLQPVPELDILNESIRNLYFHVPLWFSMVVILLLSFIYSIAYLSSSRSKADLLASEYANTGVFLGILGLLTGMVWAKYTWGTFWTNDPKLNSVAIGMLVYLGYVILRQAVEDPEKKGRVSAVFNIFAFPIFVVLIFILPRMSVSLHPGNGGNPGFSSYDLDSRMRVIFYPAVLGWILIGAWISVLRSRLRNLEIDHENNV